MSLEVNGNSATITKRRKKPNVPTGKPGDNNIPNYTNYHTNFTNSNIPEHAPYYFPFTYQQHLTSEPMSLPVYPFAYPTIPYSTSNVHTRNYVNSSNKYNSLQNPHINNETNEYMSLPIGSFDQNENSSDKRRFSDPGVLFESDSSTNSLDDRIVQKLTHQVNALKESNRKLNRDVIELRIELNMLKQQQSGRHFDREYEPGMLAEVIKEIRDAARVREDALLAKVKHMIEEKQFTLNQMHLLSDKSRLNKLEEQMKNLSVSHRSEDNVSLQSSSAIEENTNSARQVIELEREVLHLRREIQDARAKREESDQKVQQLEKKLSNFIRHKETLRSDVSEDGKTSTSADSYSLTTVSSGPMSSAPIVSHRVTVTGPVTDL